MKTQTIVKFVVLTMFLAIALSGTASTMLASGKAIALGRARCRK